MSRLVTALAPPLVVSPVVVAAVLLTASIALPAVGLAVVAGSGSGTLWPHLLRHVLPAALLETLLYLGGTGLFVVAVGAGTAWLTTCYRFPGSRVLAWVLPLPLAVPAYIAAYSYLDLLHPVGPVQSFLRSAGYMTRLPDIRSLGGCILVSGLVLYPYVYLTARSAFAVQAADALWAARSIGAGGWTLFLRIGLPIARPAVAVGLALALMEALNDVGASEFLGIRTLTVSVYVTWLTRGSLEGAAQIALVVLAVALIPILLERWGRRDTAFAGDPATGEPGDLHGWAAAGACAACLLPVLLGFGIPLLHLGGHAAAHIASAGLPPALGGWIVNSAWYAGWATLMTLAGGLLLAFAARAEAARLWPSRLWPRLLPRLGALGYALPGGIAAVGLTIVLGGADTVIDRVAIALSGSLMAWSLLGSGLALILAYAIRFMAVPAGGLDAAYAGFSRDYDWAARSLGCSQWRLLTRIHLPNLVWPLATAGLIVFIDGMKELPATLLLRPVNVETLATALYGEALRGVYEDGAVAALALILVALPAAALLTRLDRRTASRS